MKTAFLGLLFLVLTCGLAAKPLTFTFEEYQVDPATVIKERDYPLELLVDLKPIASQSVELSEAGNGKAVATMGDSKITLEVRAVSGAKSRYRISVKHEFVSAYAGEYPITTSHGGEPNGTYEVGDERVVSTIRIGVDGEDEAYVLVIKLTD